MPTPTAIPDSPTLSAAAALEIFDVNGNKVKFGSVFDEEKKTVVVFIRHFFCGSCQAYVNQLSTVPQPALDAARAQIIIIGCGEWQPIRAYSEMTDFHGPIYSDPTRTLFRHLGMNIEHIAGTPAGEKKKSYVPGAVSNTLLSIARGLQHPMLLGKWGNLSQIGGDFVFGPGGQECVFAYRMQHSQDHVEVADLMKAAGVEFS